MYGLEPELRNVLFSSLRKMCVKKTTASSIISERTRPSSWAYGFAIRQTSGCFRYALKFSHFWTAWHCAKAEAKTVKRLLKSRIVAIAKHSSKIVLYRHTEIFGSEIAEPTSWLKRSASLWMTSPVPKDGGCTEFSGSLLNDEGTAYIKLGCSVYSLLYTLVCKFVANGLVKVQSLLNQSRYLKRLT